VWQSGTISLTAVKFWIAIVLAIAVLSATAAEEKRLSVYTPQQFFWVTLTEREGQDYVALLDILSPLGSVTARRDGDKWKLAFDRSESEFKVEKNKAKVNKKNVELAGPFILENGRGMIPLRSLSVVLPRLLPQAVAVREFAHRVFIGNAMTQFAEIFQPNPTKLVLQFSGPVNPQISTNGNKIRITFTREPVIAPSNTQTFDEKTIRSATFSEHDSIAELSVQGAIPLIAAVGDQNRTITIIPAPQRAEAPPPPPPVAPEMPATSQPSNAQAALPVARPRATVVIDPGHGGEDRGATLSETLVEKEVALGWSRKLRAALEQKGIPATLLRDGDVSLTADQRAALANAARPVIFLTVHAGSVGSGVRIYTAQLGESLARPGTFLPWDSAQAAFLDSSRSLAGSIVAEISKQSIPVGTAPVLLKPLNSVSASAIAIEFMPPANDIAGLMSATYQQSIAGAIADGIAATLKSTGNRAGAPGAGK